jgi:hypothetical protein
MAYKTDASQTTGWKDIKSGKNGLDSPNISCHTIFMKESSRLPKSLTSVTLFSKMLALIILVFVFPLVGFLMGMYYQHQLDSLTPVSPTPTIISPTPTHTLRP